MEVGQEPRLPNCVILGTSQQGPADLHARAATGASSLEYHKTVGFDNNLAWLCGIGHDQGEKRRSIDTKQWWA